MTLAHGIELAVGIILEVALVFAAAMFRRSYMKTKDRSAYVLAIVFAFAALVKLPEVIFSHGLQMDIPILESMHDLLFVFVILAIAWALWPRSTWKMKLKEKS
jgi:hypothetical protein